MARERMVTRTVELTVAHIMALDTTTAEVRTLVCELGGGLTDEKAILKNAKKIHETATYKLVAVQSVETKEILYGMSEADFIRHAKVLPPRKGNDTDNTDTIED